MVSLYKIRNPEEIIQLSERELEVLKLVAKGDSNTEIAEKLYISTNTAKAHVSHIYEKFNTHGRVNAVVTALRNGIID